MLGKRRRSRFFFQAGFFRGDGRSRAQGRFRTMKRDWPGAGATDVPVSNTKPRASPSIGNGGRLSLARPSTLGAGDLFSGGNKLEDRACLLLVVADDAGIASDLAEGMLSRFFRMLRLQAVAGLALDIGIIPDVGRVEKGRSVAEGMAADAIVARFVAGFLEVIEGMRVGGCEPEGVLLFMAAFAGRVGQVPGLVGQVFFEVLDS